MFCQRMAIAIAHARFKCADTECTTFVAYNSTNHSESKSHKQILMMSSVSRMCL